jgi:hypothetical protein
MGEESNTVVLDILGSVFYDSFLFGLKTLIWGNAMG